MKSVEQELVRLQDGSTQVCLLIGLLLSVAMAIPVVAQSTGSALPPPSRGSSALIPSEPTLIPVAGGKLVIALGRSVRLPGGQPLALGEVLGRARPKFVRRPDGRFAYTGARLDAPAGAQLVVKVDANRRITHLQVVHPPRTLLPTLVAAYGATYGQGLESRSGSDELLRVTWQDGQTALTVQSYRQPNGVFVVTELCELAACR